LAVDRDGRVMRYRLATPQVRELVNAISAAAGNAQ
jgi:hypothetical protein